jgi:hypothetical protein
VEYWRSQINFYTSLCTSQNWKCQRLVSDVITVDQIMNVLKRGKEFSEQDKKQFIDLLLELYVTSAVNGPKPKSLIPTMLIWKGEHTLLNWDTDESEETSKKVFVMATQPGFQSRDADWVSTWEANVDEDEVEED